jgi:2,3-bisphosphoglycerate-independent phosphoglycerate mutase
VKEDVLKELIKTGKTKILLIVIDGLGGLPHPDYGFKTELEYAKTPNLDELASKSVLGMTIPVEYGIIPGSGPAHLSLFGYDPFQYEIGRGVLEALGIGFPLTERDVAIRGNFATIDGGIIVDRRAGRISSEESREIVSKIQAEIREIEDVEIIIKPGKEHRFVLILRGEGLSDRVKETDPQKEGMRPFDPSPLDRDAVKTSRILKKFLSKVERILKGEKKANSILLRGYAKTPNIQSFPDRYNLKSLAIATYPMYKGITRLLGMETPDVGETLDDEISYLQKHFDEYDFFYVHYKDPDKAGEDGDFLKKVETIEFLDSRLDKFLELKPDVLVITGDHSTPALWGSHSWHPNPLLIHSEYAGSDDARFFTERECKNGYLGIFHAKYLMPQLLAMASRLKKFGA